MHLHFYGRGCCTVSEQPKKIPCGIGLLAHVDAGKTTLSEGLLAHAGAIRSRGAGVGTSEGSGVGASGRTNWA